MKSIRILFFASIKAMVGRSKVELQMVDTATVSMVLETLYTTYPQLEVIKAHTLVALNQKYILDDEDVPDGAELADARPGLPSRAPVTSRQLLTGSDPRSGYCCGRVHV